MINNHALPWFQPLLRRQKCSLSNIKRGWILFLIQRTRDKKFERWVHEIFFSTFIDFSDFAILYQQQYSPNRCRRVMYRLDLGFRGGPFYKVEVVGWLLLTYNPCGLKVPVGKISLRLQLWDQLTVQNKLASTGIQLVGAPTGPYLFGPTAHWLMLWLLQSRSSPMPIPELIFKLFLSSFFQNGRGAIKNSPEKKFENLIILTRGVGNVARTCRLLNFWSASTKKLFILFSSDF